MTDLRQAAQSVVERWDSPKWEWSQQGPTADLMASLRTALKQQQAEPVSHAVIVGALFDFMGWLTTRKERLILSSTDNASPAADAIKVFAEMRGLSLDDALVQDWQNYATPPQQQAEALQAMNDQLITGTSIMLDGKRVDPASVYKQAEPVAWDKPSASFNGWWDSYHHDPANPFAEGLAAYWAWAGWKAAQRQWVGLTDEDYLNALDLHPHEGTDREFWNVLEAKLKEKNNG